MYHLSVILLIIGAASSDAKPYKLCVTNRTRDSLCDALTVESKRVSCLRVADSKECAIRLAKGEADFGVFSINEMMFNYHEFMCGKVMVISQLRYKGRFTEEYEIQSVVVVHSSFDPKNGLKGVGLCHPGIGDSQIWNDRVLKYFEKKVYVPTCHGMNITASENEILNLKAYFGKGCRPGAWVYDEAEDKKLKSKYHELCELCDNKSKCEYHNMDDDGHFGALDCLINGNENVAYVAYEYARQFFGLKMNFMHSPLVNPKEFKFLCEDNTTRPLKSVDPCAWIKRPWMAIVARNENATELVKELKNWLPNTAEMSRIGKPNWTLSLESILADDSRILNHLEKPMTLDQYTGIQHHQHAPINNDPCQKNIRWCIVSSKVINECKQINEIADMGLDIVPMMNCFTADSSFECMKNIADDKADVAMIDSNYGHAARQVFDLSTLMYVETKSDPNDNLVIAVVREKATNKVTSFRDLRNRKACFPEYGGIAWFSFLNFSRTAKIISDSCDYSRIVSKFFSGACAPGIRDTNHSSVIPSHKVTEILCSLCPACSADRDNHFYGDRGALMCVKSGDGDVAFVETKNLFDPDRIDDKLVHPNDYRVLCRNGSLANYKGFKVDKPCALSVLTIDSEIIGLKGKSTERLLSKDVTLALSTLKNWFNKPPKKYDPIRIFHMSSSENNSILAYKELFSHVESCLKVKNTGVIMLAIILFFALLIALTLIIYFVIKKHYKRKNN